MTLTATAGTIAAVGSHSVTAGSESGAKIQKEECFPVVPMQWRGKAYRAQFNADRYASSNGVMSDWRVYLYSAREDDGTSYGSSATLTDAMRRAMNETGQPLVHAWLRGETATDDDWTYTRSRARAFRHFVARKMTSNDPSEWSIRYAEEALETHADELDEPERVIHSEALAHLQRFRSTIDRLD